MMGATCTKCSLASLPSTASVADCTSCTNSKGFASQNGVCALSSSQTGVASPTVTGGVCSCPTGQAWNVILGGCVCDWGKTYVTYINSDDKTFTCKKCPYIWSDGSCACGADPLYQSSNFNVCTNCNNDPNSARDSNGYCVCKSGYGWSEASFPFKCVPGFSGGSYMSVGAATTYPLCSSLSSSIQSYCKLCDVNHGFVLMVAINECLYCQTVSGSTGNAFLNGCECQSGFNWNAVAFTCDSGAACSGGYLYNPSTKACDICDPIKSVIVNSNCVSCQADANSVGYAATASSCACNTNYVWTSTLTGGSCSSGTCNAATSIWIGAVCFTCPSTNNGGGAAVGTTACSCLNGYTWQTSGSSGSCVCNSASSIVLSTGNCQACPSNTHTLGIPDGSGGCKCSNNYVWSASMINCICDSTVSSLVTTSGSCFQCLTVNDPNFDGTIASGGCNCINGFVYSSSSAGGNCVCNSPSIVLSSGKCASCPINANTTGGFDNNGVCDCNNNYIWSATRATCICDSTVSAFITSSASCFQCLSTYDANFDGTIVNGGCNCINGWTFVSTSTEGSCTCSSPKIIQNGVCVSCPTNANTTGATDGSNGCLCKNSYIWDGVTKKTCICDSTVSAIILPSGACFQCISTSDPKFDGTIVNGACKCSNSFTLTTTNGLPSCVCASPSFVTSSGTCFTCSSQTSTGTPDGKGGCLCATGLVWNTTTLACTCNSNSGVANDGSCFTCGAAGTFTSTTTNGAGCKCNSTGLTWNSAALVCDCGQGSAFLLNGNSFTCVTCNSKVNANQKDTPYTCACISSLTTWNAATGQCDCGTTSIYSNSICIACDASRFASGQNISNPKTCNCPTAGMTWSRSAASCVCSSNSVAFTVNGVVSCQVCDSSIYAKKGGRSSPIACNCNSGSVWVPNVGCVCTGQNAIPITKGSNTVCVVCNSTIYSSGASGLACVCLGSLTWQSSSQSCGCSSKYAIAVSNGQYFCSSCTSTNNAKTPLVSPTQCTCVSTSLVWSA
jgi:hypothetical protein